MTIPEFGDRVRVLEVPETEALGIAGLLGQVYGWTHPESTGVPFFGPVNSDVALSIHIEGRDELFWLAPALVEFVDHRAGTTVEIGGKKLVRRADGVWDKVET